MKSYQFKLLVVNNTELYEAYSLKYKEKFEVFDKSNFTLIIDIQELINNNNLPIGYLFNFSEIFILEFNEKIEIKIPKVYYCEYCIDDPKIPFKISKYAFIPKFLVGKKIYEEYVNINFEEIKQAIKRYHKSLAIIKVGNDYASNIYVKNKVKLGERFNLKVNVVELKADICESELLNQIQLLNEDVHTGGILIQLPLPKHLDTLKILNYVAPNKDVDCFNKQNVGLLFQNNITNKLFPCTPKGIMLLLNYYQIPITNKHVVIVGRSNIVGKPLALMMLNNDATVTICHSKTRNLKQITKTADILVSAIGKPRFFDHTYVKKGVVCIDVGINYDNNKHICGDFNLDETLYDKVSFITPVPYGVGPLTLIMLLDNFLCLNDNQGTKKLN